MSPFEIEDLTQTVKQDQTDPGYCEGCLKRSCLNGKPHWKYIQAILRNWRREGITSLTQLKIKQQEREALQPENVTVSDDFLQAMDLWKD